METNWLELLSGQNQINVIRNMNEKTATFGLTLTKEDAVFLMKKRQESLREEQRVEFGEGILPKIIYAFCDSPFIYQDNYVDTLVRLQEIFYLYKNEALDQFTDDELLGYMVESFNGKCQGSLEYLEDTALEELARDIRAQSNDFFGQHYRLRGTSNDEL